MANRLYSSPDEKRGSGQLLITQHSEQDVIAGLNPFYVKVEREPQGSS
jgi:hypothetical protein